MENERTRAARAELRAWYLERLQPKLARAATSGAIEPRAVVALDADVRALLDITEGHEEAA